MTPLRTRVAALMAEAHRISPALAAWHTEQMPAAEVRERFLRYIRQKAGMKLSAADPNPERSTSVLPGSDARNDDGRPAALYCVPQVEDPRHARFGEKATGSGGRGGFCPGAVLPESEVENRELPEAGTPFSGEGLCF